MPKGLFPACLLMAAVGCQRTCGADAAQVGPAPSAPVAAPAPPPPPARVENPALEGWFSIARADGDDVELLVQGNGFFQLLPGDLPQVPGVQVGAKVAEVGQ